METSGLGFRRNGKENANYYTIMGCTGFRISGFGV